LSVGNNTILGRASGGGSEIAALSGSDARTVLGLSTLATTTPAANVATFLETPTSANLAAAVTDETGSGSLVFGTSPTLTSPTIGTSATFNATTYTYGTGAAAAHVAALGTDARYGLIQSKTSSTQVDSTNTTRQDVTGLSGFELEADSHYRMELYCRLTNGASASHSFFLDVSNALAYTGAANANVASGFLNNAGTLQPAVMGLTAGTSSNYFLMQRTVTGANMFCSAVVYFKTGSLSSTAKLQFSQWFSPANTASLLSGAMLSFTKIK
jgi:hypothetical protein